MEWSSCSGTLSGGNGPVPGVPTHKVYMIKAGWPARRLRRWSVAWAWFALSTGLSSVQAAPPVVTQVTAVQIAGTHQVEIRYVLSDPNGNDCLVWVEVSDDDGATWSVPASGFSGDVGIGVRPGTGKRIVWNAGADMPGRAGYFRFRVSADNAPVPTGMALIPAGEFLMGDSFNEGSGDERPVHAVWVNAFFMDRTEVTNQQYAAALNGALAQGLIQVSNGFVRGTGNNLIYCDTTTSSSLSRITWNGSTFGVVSGKENHPMVRVSWYGSAAYANWRSGMEGRTPSYNTTTWACDFSANGYRLPTEAEWEKAARGGASGRRFPWPDTDTIQHARANYYSSSSYSYDTSPTRGYHPTFNTGTFPYTSPVGYFAPNGYGLYDMAGNAWEWCNDWWSSSFYGISPYSNPRGPVSGSSRVLRGGSWINVAFFLRCAIRGYGRPDIRGDSIGFRLALD
jgi:formylglycine-generating enzyme